MFDYKKQISQKQLASIFIKIAEKITEDKEFANYILSGILVPQNPIPKNKKKSKNIEENSENDIFLIYQKQGSEGLLKMLKSLDSQDLKKLILQNGLNPAQKVRRWRKQERIISFIIESVSKQMSKGGAFLKNI